MSDTPKLCRGCHRQIIETGYRLEKRGGHASWIPTTVQEAFIRENWEKLFIAEIAAHVGITDNVLKWWSKRANLPIKKRSYKHYHKEWCEIYKNGATIQEIMDRYNVAKTTVSKALLSNDIKMRRPGGWSTRKR